MLFDLFLRRYERILVEISVFERGCVILSANVRREEGVVHHRLALHVRKLESLGYHEALFA